MRVEEFISGEMNKPFAWAENDCTMMCDRWVRLKRAKSPVEAGSIIYHDKDSALKILPYLPHLMNRGMRRAGIEKTKEPKIGDVGLVLFSGRVGPALLVGNHWITRHENGFMAAPLGNIWKAWDI